MSDLTVSLTAAEAKQVAEDMMALLVRYREQSTYRAGDESVRVAVTTQFQIFPRRGQLYAPLATRTVTDDRSAAAGTESSGTATGEPPGVASGGRP